MSVVLGYFKEKGIPPRFGQTQEEYRDFVGSLRENDQKIRKTLDLWKNYSWDLVDNPVFPRGYPVVVSVDPDHASYFSQTKVRLDPVHSLYLPKVRTDRYSTEKIAYGVLKTQRRNMFGQESFTEGIVSATQPLSSENPYVDDSLYVGSGLVSFITALLIPCSVVLLKDPVVVASLVAFESFILSATIAGVARKHHGINRAYQKAKKVAQAAGPDVLQFLPQKDIVSIAEKDMDKTRIREYLENAFNSTKYVNYELALCSLK